jgi:hypothetical protein
MTFFAKYVGFFTVVRDFLAENVGFSRPICPKLLKNPHSDGLSGAAGLAREAGKPSAGWL